MHTHLMFKWDWADSECELYLIDAIYKHHGCKAGPSVLMDIWDEPDSIPVGRLLRRCAIGVPFKVHMEATIS